MNIASIMKPQVEIVEVEQTVKEANDKMLRGHFRHLPVMDGGNLVGIVSNRDLTLISTDASKENQSLQNMGNAEKYKIRDVMTSNPLILSPTDSIKKAMEAAIDKKYGAFPVVEQGRLVGIVTVIDFLGLFVKLLEEGKVTL